MPPPREGFHGASIPNSGIIYWTKIKVNDLNKARFNHPTTIAWLQMFNVCLLYFPNLNISVSSAHHLPSSINNSILAPDRILLNQPPLWLTSLDCPAAAAAAAEGVASCGRASRGSRGWLLPDPPDPPEPELRDEPFGLPEDVICYFLLELLFYFHLEIIDALNCPQSTRLYQTNESTNQQDQIHNLKKQ